METNIQKWGNSLGVRLPGNLAAKKSLKVGTRVVITETKQGIALKVVEKPTVQLTDLVRSINKKNTHQELDWMKPVGKEVW